MLSIDEIFERLDKEIEIKSYKGTGNGKFLELWYMIGNNTTRYVLEDFSKEAVDNLINMINEDVKNSKDK